MWFARLYLASEPQARVYAVLCTARPLDAGEVQPRHYTWLVATSLGDRRRLGLRHSLSGAMANCYVFLRS